MLMITEVNRDLESAFLGIFLIAYLRLPAQRPMRSQ